MNRCHVILQAPQEGEGSTLEELLIKARVVCTAPESAILEESIRRMLYLLDMSLTYTQGACLSILFATIDHSYHLTVDTCNK